MKLARTVHHGMFFYEFF